MLHFVARKFGRVSSQVCPNEGSDCSRSTSMITQLKNSSTASTVLLDSNKSQLRHHREYILNCDVPIIDSNSLLKRRSSELYHVLYHVGFRINFFKNDFSFHYFVFVHSQQ